MKRQIKFRGWASDTKEMMPWDEFMVEWLEDDEVTMLQFTGLKDKNGKEIYEGDIIRSFDSKGNEIVHIVVYENEYARFSIKHKIANIFDSPMQIYQAWITEFEKEVIGNVYQNPELLS